MTDLKSVLAIYEYARAQMKLNGNPMQWKDNRPSEAVIINDIKNNNSYVIEQGGEICGVFTFIIGEDPTYKYIEGQWMNEEAYGTVHRIASNGTGKGIFDQCLDYCETRISNLRMDTHCDNKIMQHLLDKNQFKRCGVIYVDDGTSRIAYQKVISR